ncbi:MAG TPA: fatty acid desaturase [Gemmataceae bacterium]|nr:fatty acid desaturase [Gemmataceae bacterium]
MGGVQVSQPKGKSLKDAELKEKLQALRRTDNWTNLFFLVRIYLFFVVVIGGAVWFDLWRASAHWSVWWDVPVGLAAIILIGAGQHQLSGLAHEAVHHILFRNRWLNDLASDLFCMFPLYSSTHHYRLQHLAHHQFVNDPERDPDVSQLKTSGHWLDFPVGKRVFLRTLLKQLWLPNLIRFTRIRAMYNAAGADRNPYLRKSWKPSKMAVGVGALYLLLQAGALTILVWCNAPALWLALIPALLWAAITTVYLMLPATKFHQSRVHPVIPSRVQAILRTSHLTAVYVGLAWITWATAVWAACYYFFFWLVPLFTSFAFFMILRQIVQHGNGGRGWLTNTRVFLLRPIIRFSVFPIGQDYHLPHHIYATVPHYRLRRLHEMLLEYPEYQEQAVVVEGYFLPPHAPQTRPTVLDVLGPDYAPRDARDVHIDDSVLEDDEVEEKAEILREGELEKRRAAGQTSV